jgi:hypothetical protein
MGPEVTIRERVFGPGTRRIWLLSVMAFLLVALSLWKFLPGKPAERLFEMRGLKLLDSVVHLPAASFQRVDFALPCAGTLSLDLACGEGNSIEVFVVPPSEVAKMKANQAFAHLGGFDGHMTEKYQRTVSLSPGKYCLVLIDTSSRPFNSSRTPIQVRACLSDLN